MDWLFVIQLVYLVFVIAPVCTLIHECGHGVGSKWTGAEKINISVGMGKTIFSFTIHTIQFHIRTIFFIGGWTKSAGKDNLTKGQALWISFSGPLFNMLFAMLSFIPMTIHPNEFIELFFWFNVWLAAVNLVPFRIGNKYTDGYAMHETLFSRKKIE